MQVPLACAPRDRLKSAGPGSIGTGSVLDYQVQLKGMLGRSTESTCALRCFS